MSPCNTSHVLTIFCVHHDILYFVILNIMLSNVPQDLMTHKYVSTTLFNRHAYKNWKGHYCQSHNYCILASIEHNKRVRGSIQTFGKGKMVSLFFLFCYQKFAHSSDRLLSYVLGLIRNFLIFLSLVSCIAKFYVSVILFFFLFSFLG